MGLGMLAMLAMLALRAPRACEQRHVLVGLASDAKPWCNTEMAAEQWNKMLVQELVRILIWERHGHSNGFQKQEKETV
jgi:hypothetical protein